MVVFLTQHLCSVLIKHGIHKADMETVKKETSLWIYCILFNSAVHFEHIQGVPGGKDLTSGECSLGQTIPI